MDTALEVHVLPYQEGVRDADGYRASGHGDPRPEPVYGWAPGGSSEISARRDRLSDDLEVYVPPDFACSPDDQVIVAGRTYEVSGSVQDFAAGNPFGWQAGGVLYLNRTT